MYIDEAALSPHMLIHTRNDGAVHVVHLVTAVDQIQSVNMHGQDYDNHIIVIVCIWAATKLANVTHAVVTHNGYQSKINNI